MNNKTLNNDFFDRLYKGYAAENFITGQLFEYGFEAFRLPADFGIDLVVTNQFNKLKNKEIDNNSFPFGFQVKSRRLKESNFSVAANGRNQYRFDYSITYKEITTLQDFPNSALAFVFIVPFGHSIKNIYAFCIHSRDIGRMIQGKVFEHKLNDKGESYYKLNVCFRSLPQHNRKTFIDEMVDKKMINNKGIKFLEQQLPEIFPRNWKAKEWLYLYRKLPEEREERLDKTLYDFSNFPNFP